MSSFLSNGDPAAIEGLYLQFCQNPDSVDPEWRCFFQGFEFSKAEFHFDGEVFGLDVIEGTESERAIDVRKLRNQTGLVCFDPGYVKSTKETVEVPCTPGDTAGSKVIRKTVVEYDTNDCSDGTIAGALLGGGLAGFGSRGKDRWWAIPSGIIGGAMVGCQLDGG